MVSASKADRLPATIQLFSRKDLEQALFELGELRGARDQFEGELNKELAEARDRFARKCSWQTSDSQRVGFDDREKQILEAVQTYCTAHRTDLISEGKSVDLDHGRIGFKACPPRVETVPGKVEKKVLDKLKDAVMGKLGTALKSIKLLGFGDHNEDVLRLKVEINKAGILSAFDRKHISNEQLRKHGLCVATGGEEFYCEPTKHELKGHLANVA